MATGSRLNDFMRLIVGFRGAPLRRRIFFGALTAAVGSLVAQLLGGLVDDTLLASFYPSVQIAALLGGMAAAASSAVVSALIVHLWIMPFCCFWTAYLLFFVTAGLAAAMGEALRAARAPRSAVEEPPGAGDLASPQRSFEAIAAAITHDVNQPLAAAAAYLHTARRVLAAEPTASVGDTLDKAAAQLTRAGRLVKRLRSFLGHGPPRLAPVGLHPLILDAVLSRRSALEPSLRLDAHCDAAFADAAQIEELLDDILRRTEAGGLSTTIATSSDAAAITVRIDFGHIAGGDPEGASADASLWRAIVEANHGVFRMESSADGAVAIEFALPLAATESSGPC